MDKTLREESYEIDVNNCFLLGAMSLFSFYLLILCIVHNTISGIIIMAIFTMAMIIADIYCIVSAIKEKRKIKKQELEIKEIAKEASKKIYKELKMNWETLMKQEEIYENLKIRDKVCKNKFGKIKNKKLQDNFLNEIVDRAYFSYENTITIKDVVDEIKDYKFGYREIYVEKLAEYEKMQEILDKYKEE